MRSAECGSVMPTHSAIRANANFDRGLMSKPFTMTQRSHPFVPLVRGTDLLEYGGNFYSGMTVPEPIEPLEWSCFKKSLPPRGTPML